MDSTDLFPPSQKKTMLLLTCAPRRSPMGNVILSVSLPVKSIAADQIEEVRNDGGNVSAYIRGLIEDDVDQLLSVHIEALQLSVKYLHACLAATGHTIEDFHRIAYDVAEIKEECE